jgi:hypothetical protein
MRQTRTGGPGFTTVQPCSSWLHGLLALDGQGFMKPVCMLQSLRATNARACRTLDNYKLAVVELIRFIAVDHTHSLFLDLFRKQNKIVLFIW